MRSILTLLCTGILVWLGANSGLRADVLEMQNGDRYSGQVLALSADTVVLNSEILGKISVPRNKVASLTFGTNAVSSKAVHQPAMPASANLPAVTISNGPDNLNLDLSGALRQLGGNTNFIGQLRQQMFAGNPAAADKFDELVTGLFSGQLSMNDLRRQAESSAVQLRELKRALGPGADDTLDEYLKILDAFVKESATEAPAR